jgi:small subunit ribosomal protein S16
MDSRTPRDGRALDEVGIYHPIEKEENQLKFDADRIREWLNKGAQTTATVRRLLNKQKFYLK